MILLAACASEKLALAPPAGVDFSGSWKLNQADSDDPQRLLEIASDNMTRIYRPSTVDRHNHTSADSEGALRRDGPPPLCGWSAKTLVVLVGDSEDVRLRVEQHYGISEDGQRLVEVVGVKGHMDGFTMSRVWDRAP